MKKAFTMIELVFVIVVVGILSAIMVPKYEQNLVLEGTQQIAEHIRYTQHLAMLDSKIDPNTANWWRRRWTLQFTNNNRYDIWSDMNNNTVMDNDEIAPDPKNATRLLTGDSTNANYNSQLNIGRKFGITNVQFGGSCQDLTGISFDEKGRPYSPAARADNNDPSNELIIANAAGAPCRITLSDGGTNVANICIAPETGYVTYGMQTGMNAAGGAEPCDQFQ